MIYEVSGQTFDYRDGQRDDTISRLYGDLQDQWLEA